MSRLIDADEFENRMYHEAFERDSDMQKWDSGCWIRYRLFEEVLRGQPTVTPEPHWIPVTERLPEKDGRYWVSGKWRSGKESVGDCEFLAEDGYFRTARNFDVIAWMPLPEPYRRVAE